MARSTTFFAVSRLHVRIDAVHVGSGGVAVLTVLIAPQGGDDHRKVRAPPHPPLAAHLSARPRGRGLSG